MTPGELDRRQEVISSSPCEFIAMLERNWFYKNTLVCVGLDPEIAKIPAHLREAEEPMFEFNKAIIDATAPFVCAFKPQSAFYEAEGADGLRQLAKTCQYIRENYSDIPVVLDAKRNDIGNTTDQYVRYVYRYLGVNAVTLNPYLGRDSLQPFLNIADRGSIILCRTSNPGAKDFQNKMIEGTNQPLYRVVAETVVNEWNEKGNCLLVVGATYPRELEEIRELAPDLPLLVPGFGAQGANAADTVKAAKHRIIANSGRAVIYKSSGTDFAEAAATEARRFRDELNQYRPAA